VSLIEGHSVATPYVISGLTVGQTYYFAITAVYVSSAESALSNEISLVPADAAALDAPGNLAAVSRNAEVELSWNAVPGAASYRLYYGVTSGVYGSSQNVGTDNRIIITGLINGRTYYFAVTAVDQNRNESEYSAEAVGNPQP
jgi:fibronectin type 3 domain-containing protein